MRTEAVDALLDLVAEIMMAHDRMLLYGVVNTQLQAQRIGQSLQNSLADVELPNPVEELASHLLEYAQVLVQGQYTEQDLKAALDENHLISLTAQLAKDAY